LENNCAGMFEATLFEASPRIGGKIVTRQFQSAQAAQRFKIAT
jgi:protoporphyrinogen oxidase